jgi:hypothetical protein
VASVSLLSFPDGNIAKSQLIGSPKQITTRDAFEIRSERDFT